jgi:uncharacterized protein (DUF2336 family)
MNTPRPGDPKYEAAMRIAEGADAAERLNLASSDDVAPEILYFLAEDTDPRVRLAVARNQATPRQADSFLSRDGDIEVRSELAGKIARLTPDLGDEQRATVRKMTVEVLETLARDEVVRVRAMISSTLKDTPLAPPEVVSRVIETLARDSNLSVAQPLLENSPLLSDEVLVEIIASPTVRGAVAAISRRWEVSTEVSDAIIDTDDEPAIIALLRNDSAQIREETLDRLIETASERPDLHEPMVRRPRLSSANALKLAKFVAISLVAELKRRAELDDNTSALLSAELSRRIEADPSAGVGLESDNPVDERNSAVRLHNNGQLTEKIVSVALASGRRAFLMAALALRSGLEEPVVHSLISSRNGKAMTALAWKADLNMAFALQLQLRLGNIKPVNAIRPNPDGQFPLSEDDMIWQIDLVADGG